MKRPSQKNLFKAYNQHQTFLLPPSLEELVAKNHPVRTVNEVIDRLDIESIQKKYKGGGATSYHPRMMLKVLVYAYLTNMYSSRKIEALLKENIHFMWLAGMSRPDHNSINRFRSEKLKDVLKQVFTQVVQLLSTSGQLSLQEIYTDGTKIESQANKYTFVWGRSIQKSRIRIEEQLKELWSYAERVTQQEMDDTDPTDFNPIDPEKVKQTIEKIDNALKGKEVDKKVKQKLNYAKRNWPEKIEKYNTQEKLLQGRNSFSKTDTGATFMRMKEDHMRNGQLKPGYNLQLSTNNQFILHYSIHPNPTDTTTLTSHLDGFEKAYGFPPQSITADAGYGSEENYLMLRKRKIKGFVKYNHFDREQKRTSKSGYFTTGDFIYNKEENTLTCPAGKNMEKTGQRREKTDNGHYRNYTIYEGENCQKCSLLQQCYNGGGNKTIRRNHLLQELKQQARSLLTSEEGIEKRKRRCTDVEPVFGNIKENKNFRRFRLKGTAKVEIEVGLIAIAHNLKKKAA